MFRYRVITGHLGAVLIALGVVGSSTARAAMPPEESKRWHEDLQFMAKEMERLHKNLYHLVSRDKFLQQVSALDAKIGSLDRNEVIVEMAKIVASVGDGHTNIYPTRDRVIGFHSLPVAFTFFEQSLYVRAAHESQRQLVGARVLRIGNQDVAQALAAVNAMIGQDNEHGARYWAQYLLAMPEVLHALGLTSSPDDIPLRVITAEGESQITLHPFEPFPIMSGDTATLFNRRADWIDARDRANTGEPQWLRNVDDAFYFEHLGDLLYVPLHRVLNSPNETLARFAERLHNEIATTAPAKVAIDLRLNRGGDATLVPPLIRSLIQSESVDQEGRLFCIIGPATFSAAQMFADALETYTNVTFVGEPTGSKGNTYGDSRIIVLPNSGMSVRVSIYYWQDWHPLDKRDSTVPQVSAPLTWEAYVKNIDPALEAIQKVRP